MRGIGGGGGAPDGGAGRIGRLCVKLAWWALCAPLGWLISGALRLVIFGTEPVVETRGRPGCIDPPAVRPTLPLRFFVGDLTPLMVLMICSRGDAMLMFATPPIGISPDVGVPDASDGVSVVGDGSSRRRACVAGES